MDITSCKRAKIVALSENTEMSVRQIAAAVCVSKSSVSRIVKLHNITGGMKTSRKGRNGAKRKTTPRDDANPKNQHHGPKEDQQWHKKRYCTSWNWCRCFHCMPPSSRMWPQGTASYQGYRSNFIRRSSEESLRSGHINQAPKQPPKVMFCSCFTVGPETLHPIEGMLNSTKYIELDWFQPWAGRFLMVMGCFSKIWLPGITPRSQSHSCVWKSWDCWTGQGICQIWTR